MLERAAELKSLDGILNRNRRYRTQMLKSMLWLRRGAQRAEVAPIRNGSGNGSGKGGSGANAPPRPDAIAAKG
jgi:hypothetical protein